MVLYLLDMDSRSSNDLPIAVPYAVLRRTRTRAEKVLPTIDLTRFKLKFFFEGTELKLPDTINLNKVKVELK